MFKLERTDKFGLRHGIIETAHGRLKTPLFLPDATRGFIKTLDSADLKLSGAEALVVNTYHLFLTPGLDIIKTAGGIHGFMGWEEPLLSDSGGYQIFSLIRNLSRKREGKKPLGKITDEGVWFKSPVGGKEHFLSPEKSIEIQFDLGVDMMVALDDCPPNNSGREEIKGSVERTIGWAEKCLREYNRQIVKRKLDKKNRPLIFSVIQGGEYEDLRQECYNGIREAEEAVNRADKKKAGAKKMSIRTSPEASWDGYGFGARPVDSQGRFLKNVLKFTAGLIPENKIRFALGIGAPQDIWRCARLGWDMFDCVIPTREGRHGRLYLGDKGGLIRHDKVHYNTINIMGGKFQKDFSPLDPFKTIPVLGHSKAYLNYLMRSGESLGQRIATINNLNFYNRLITELRTFK